MKFKFELSLGGLGRDISDDDWENTDKKIIETWQELQRNYSTFERTYLGEECEFAFDWTAPIGRLEQTYDIYSRLFDANGHVIESVMNEFGQRVVAPRVTATVESRAFNEKSRGRASHLLANALLDLFLAMNLSFPGCCDFYSVKLLDVSSSGESIDSELRHLSGHKFEVALLLSIDGKFPDVEPIPVGDCINWIKNAGDTSTTTAKSAPKKLLYALLHFGNAVSSESDVIWIFYILETVFDTRPGENFNALHRRICRLLVLSDNQAGQFKKRLRRLYNLRSSLIHGGHEILHPDHHSLLDSEIGQKQSKAREDLEFGVALSIAVVREMVRNQFARLEFSEELTGVTFSGAHVPS
ncbi:MAG: hypothetical protein AAGJ68_05410 [Pseudomonadota bacterium]